MIYTQTVFCPLTVRWVVRVRRGMHEKEKDKGNIDVDLVEKVKIMFLYQCEPRNGGCQEMNKFHLLSMDFCNHQYKNKQHDVTTLS